MRVHGYGLAGPCCITLLLKATRPFAFLRFKRESKRASSDQISTSIAGWHSAFTFLCVLRSLERYGGRDQRREDRATRHEALVPVPLLLLLLLHEGQQQAPRQGRSRSARQDARGSGRQNRRDDRAYYSVVCFCAMRAQPSLIF